MFEGLIYPPIYGRSAIKYNKHPFIRINSPDCALIVPGSALLDVLWMEDNQPLSYITPYGTMVLCNFLSLKEELTPCYDLEKLTWDKCANGYRLPTSAEFEWALRYTKNKITPANRAPGLLDFEEYCWYLSNRFTQGKSVLGSMGSHLVGTKKPNDLGIYDLSGNMSEIQYPPIAP